MRLYVNIHSELEMCVVCLKINQQNNDDNGDDDDDDDDVKSEQLLHWIE